VRPFLIILLNLLAAASLLAQAEPLPEQPALEYDAETGDPVFTEPLPLIPETPEDVPRPGTGRGEIQQPAPDQPAATSKTAESINEMRMRIRYREVKTEALRDPAVQAEWERAERATVDAEKRDALKSYYTKLYARMLKIDGSIEKLVATRQANALSRLVQKRGAQKEWTPEMDRRVQDDLRY
jgi:hypothetical protein